jgi:hypothetical protein
MLSKSNQLLNLVVVHDIEQLSFETQISLAKLLETRNVKSNGKLTVRCSLECNIKEIKAKIAEIIKDSLIKKRTLDQISKIPEDQINTITKHDLCKINLGYSGY